MIYKLHDVKLIRVMSAIQVDFTLSKSKTGKKPWEIVQTHSMSISLSDKPEKLVADVVVAAERIVKRDTIESDVLEQAMSILEDKTLEI